MLYEDCHSIGIGINCVMGYLGPQNIVGSLVDVLINIGDNERSTGIGGFSGWDGIEGNLGKRIGCKGGFRHNRNVSLGTGATVRTGGINVDSLCVVGTFVQLIGPNPSFGVGIGGFGGFSGFMFNDLGIVMCDCVMNYVKNYCVGIGSVGGAGVDNNILLFAGEGGFYGFVYGYLNFKGACSGAGYCGNKCQVLTYQSSPPKSVYMNGFIGFSGP